MNYKKGGSVRSPMSTSQKSGIMGSSQLEYYICAFIDYPDKWRVQLSRWAFAVAVRNRLLLPSATKENSYYLADCLFARRGRPAKKD